MVELKCNTDTTISFCKDTTGKEMTLMKIKNLSNHPIIVSVRETLLEYYIHTEGGMFIVATTNGEIPLTMPMVVKLMHGTITYTVTNIKTIVCYHIRRNHCAYLSHRKTMLLKSSL